MTRRLLISYLSLAVVVLAMLEVPLGFINARSERARLTSKVERDAVTIASLAESTVEGEVSTSNLAALKAVGARYQADTGARVVITNRKGIALVDPSPSAPGRRSFASRPEFEAALGGDYSTGIRYSSTLGYDLLFVAVPIDSGGVVHGAVRMTYPTSELDRRVRNYWLALVGIAVVVLAAATLIGLQFARWIRRPLEGLELAAADAGAGELSARAPVPEGPPEIRELTLGFNDMVARVEGLVSAQQEFVADASHELRTPLTALRLRLENLERHVGAGGRGSLARGSTWIVVSVGLSGGRAELRVTDDGPGMTEEQKERAFDRFWRAGSGTPGLGLGLAITRRLVEVDGGTVELRDGPEGGLEVVVRLPAA